MKHKTNTLSFVNLKNDLLFSSIFILTLFCICNTVSAAVVTYTDRAIFNSAAPGLNVEDFETNQAIFHVTTFTPPLNSNTNNSAFGTGDITSGFTVSVLYNGGSGDLDLLKPGSVVNPPSAVVGPQSIADALEITFDIAIKAVGFDILEFANTIDSLTVSFYNDINLLDTLTIDPDRDAKFVGAISDSELITRVTTSFGNVGEVIDNISFGEVSTEPEPNPVPVPGGLILFGSGILILFRKAIQKSFSQDISG